VLGENARPSYVEVLFHAANYTKNSVPLAAVGRICVFHPCALGLETTMTTDKNNFCYPGATAPGFKIAAQLRGEKEDVVFTSCSSCFQKNLQASPPPALRTGM